MGGVPALIVALQDGPADDSIAAIAALRRKFPAAPLLLIAAAGSEALAVAVFRAGATDYPRWPTRPSELADAWHRLAPAALHPEPEPFLLSHSLAIHTVRESLRRFNTTPCSVLITRETGTGKELAATLLQSELFGYERERPSFVALTPEGTC